MKIQLYENQHIKNGSQTIEQFSITQAKGGDALLSITCSNEEVKTSLSESISEHLGNKNDITGQTLNEMLDEALLVSDGNKSGVKKRLKDCDLAMMLIHSKGVTVMQMGEGRVLQVRPHEKSALYDSRDQVLDIYTSQAKVMELNDILAGDYFLLTTKSRIELKKVVGTLCDSTVGDGQKSKIIEPLLAGDDDSMLLQHVDRVEGNTGFTLPDLDKKWKTVIGVLAAVVIALAVFSFLPKCEFKSAPENEVSTESSVPESETDKPAERPSDAVNEDNTDTTEAPADGRQHDGEKKSESKSDKKDKDKKDKKDKKDDKEAKKPDNASNNASSEPAKPAEDKPVEPVKPVTPVTPQVKPATPPATPPPATQE